MPDLQIQYSDLRHSLEHLNCYHNIPLILSQQKRKTVLMMCMHDERGHPPYQSGGTNSIEDLRKGEREERAGGYSWNKLMFL